jgi:hypothetical protein
MKKALIGLWFLGFLLLVIGITALSAGAQNIATCDKLATLSPVDNSTEIDKQKSYAKRFPLL